MRRAVLVCLMCILVVASCAYAQEKAQPQQQDGARVLASLLKVKGIFCWQKAKCRVYVVEQGGTFAGYKEVPGDYASVSRQFPVGSKFLQIEDQSAWVADFLVLPEPRADTLPPASLQKVPKEKRSTPPRRSYRRNNTM